MNKFPASCKQVRRQIIIVHSSLQIWNKKIHIELTLAIKSVQIMTPNASVSAVFVVYFNQCLGAVLLDMDDPF